MGRIACCPSLGIFPYVPTTKGSPLHPLSSAHLFLYVSGYTSGPISSKAISLMACLALSSALRPSYSDNHTNLFFLKIIMLASRLPPWALLSCGHFFSTFQLLLYLFLMIPLRGCYSDFSYWVFLIQPGTKKKTTAESPKAKCQGKRRKE